MAQRVDVLKTTILSLIPLIDNEEHLSRIAALCVNPESVPQTAKPKAKQSAAALAYPSHLYEPIKDFLTELGWDKEKNCIRWHSEGVMFEHLGNTGKLKPSDTVDDVRRCLVKNGGLQNAFCGDGDKWCLRKYMRKNGPKLVA